MSQQTLQQYLLSTHDLLYGRGYHNKPFTVKSMRQPKTKLLEAVPLAIIYVCTIYLLPLLDCERPRGFLYLQDTQAGSGCYYSLMPAESQAASRGSSSADF